VTPEEKIVQYLNEAHALESALIQTLTAHVAITPRSEYRDLLERHLAETRQHAGALLGRLGELGEGRNPLELAYGIAQTAIGQVIAAGKLPLDLLRGTAGEEKLLKNARDEAASEALEIATYDALEALADAAGDERTARLARAHRTQEEAFLRDLRALIPQLARDVLEAGTGPTGSPAATPEDPQTVALPIDDYDALPAQQIVPKLRLLTMTELGQVEEHERAGRGRKAILDRIGTLRAQTNGSQPAGLPGR
jgi:ferritin-like metal-binding protein YciE